MRGRNLAAALVVVTLALSSVLAAPEDARPSDTHAEWAGLYRVARAAELGDLRASLPDTPPRIEGIHEDLDAVIQPHLQPWALAKMEQTNGVADDTGAICQNAGFFRVAMVGFMWLPAGNKILVVANALYSGGVRRIYLDSPHPQHPPLSWLGHSVGHWEGDTLVVDTTGFNDKSWLASSRQPHTEQLHVVERFRMAAPGLLEVKTFVEDWQALTTPYTFLRYMKRTGTEFRENVCGGDPGEQRMWSEWRERALRQGMLPLTKK